MGTKFIMFLGLVFALGTIISLTFGGAWVGTEEVTVTNALTTFKQANILGVWSVSVPNISFFVTGMKAFTQLDFAFFDGGMQLLQWVLFMVIGTAVMWGIFMVVIGVIQQSFRRI